MNQDQQLVFVALQKKLYVMTAWRQKLLALMNTGNEAKIQAELDRGALEYQLTYDIMSMMSNGGPIEMPTEAEYDRLRQTTAAVDHAVKTSAALDALIKAGGDAIDAWPLHA